MNKRIYINDLHEHVGSEVTIAGWVAVRRDHGKLIFLDIRDGGGVVQAVCSSKNEAAFTAAEQLRPEWVVRLTGTVTKRPEKMVNADQPNGGIELSISEISVLTRAEELPFDPEADIGIDTMLDYRPLTLRTPRGRAIFHVQHEIISAYREYLAGERFVEIQAPKLSGEDAEGGAGVFAVPYFHEKNAYLATSPQLYKQIMVGVFERVFATGNVFRAEKHATSRHLNEYTSLDVEFGFINDHTDVMRLETDLLRFVCERLKERCAREFALLGAEVPAVPDEIPSMKMREAQELIKKETGVDHTGEPDLDPSDERFLCEYARETLGSDFIFITHYPSDKRPFYTYDDPDEPGFTRSFDLLFRGVEITTGGQRVHEPDVLAEKARAKGLDPEKFSFFMQTFRYGMPQHGGWGMGLERLTQKMLNLESVKEATLFPRDMNRIDTRLTE